MAPNTNTENVVSEKNDAVVVPAITSGSSVACIRSLGRRGIRTIAVGESESVPAFRSKYCHETVVIAPPEEDLTSYRDTLLSLARRPDVVSVLPLREADVYVLSKHRDKFTEYIATPWPPFSTVRQTHDWLKLRDVAIAADVPFPETWRLSEWEPRDRPAVVKSRYSIVVEGDRGRTPGELHLEAGETVEKDEIIKEMGHEPIVQEYVPGNDEYGFFALFDEGTPVAKFQHRRVRSFNYTGGASVFRKSIADPDLEELGLRMLNELDWHGPAMVEFKRSERDGELKLMEINPRFWGSLPLSVVAGVDFPYLYYLLATGEEFEPTFEYNSGVGCHLIRGEISYLYSLVQDSHPHIESPPLSAEVAAILTSMLRHPNFDQLDTDDIEPFVGDISGMIDFLTESRRSN